MSTFASRLDSEVSVVCPIYGVSIGRKNDKSTWRIDFAPEATAQQRLAAQSVVDAFDVAAVEAAQAASQAALETLATEAHADAVYAQLATATGAEISSFITTQFPLFTPPQKAIMKIILHTVALVLRRG